MKKPNIVWIIILLIAIAVTVCGCSNMSKQIPLVNNILIKSNNTKRVNYVHNPSQLSPTLTHYHDKINSKYINNSQNSTNRKSTSYCATPTPIPSPTSTPTPKIIFEKTLVIKGSGYWDKIFRNRSRLIFINKKYCRSGYIEIHYEIKNPRSKVYMLMTTESSYKQYLEFGTWTSYSFGNPILSGKGTIKICPKYYTSGKTGLVFVPNVVPYGTISKVHFRIEYIP